MNASSALAPASQTARGRARWAAWFGLAIAGLKELGPYAAIEIILPGGTLIALALWLYRRHRARTAAKRDAVHIKVDRLLTIHSSVFAA
jgi:hypothetical protein